MQSNEVRKKYLEFFQNKGHIVIPSAPLVPQNDPTTLFNSAGMQPLISYILGEPHPLGKRLVNSQKSVRTQDIDEVGDNRHTTFFEMLGNWSLGDYFKQEQLTFIFEFLTQELNLNPQKLYVSVFAGNESVPKDNDAIEIWKELFHSVGIDAKENERIFTYPASKNWWSRAGEPEKMPTSEPGGPDSEVFYDFGISHQFHENSQWKNEKCHVNCDCGRFMEIANSVFMQYVKQSDGNLKELSEKVVDFGGGLERMTAATIDNPDIFQTDLFSSIYQDIERLSRKKYGENEEITRSIRIVADHIKGAVMMMSDGVYPSNKMQGYVLRRLIRRALLHGRYIGLTDWKYVGELVDPVIEIYKDAYPEIVDKAQEIRSLLEEEAVKFGKSLEKGLREIEKLNELNGDNAFMLYETYGFPWEMTEEIANKRGQKVEKGIFEKAFALHRQKSRSAAAGMFKGGLADHSEQTIRLHTAHHLLLAALQKIVDPSIKQRGSNITSERLRMDFNLNRVISDDEKKQVEELVNQKIQEKLPVQKIVMKRELAEKVGAQMEFGYKYPDQVNVYFIGLKNNTNPESITPADYFSAEFCGGPHVESTGMIGRFVIMKEENVGTGIRRMYASIA